MKFFDASRYASPLRKALAKKENAPRNLRFETLENRALLSVTPLDELQAAVASAEIAPAQTVETPVVDLSALAVSNATLEDGVTDLGTLTKTATLQGTVQAELVDGAWVGESDFYKVTFEVGGNSEHKIVLNDAWVVGGTNFNLDLFLYESLDALAAKTWIKSSTYNAATETISLEGVAAGTYYIEVRQTLSSDWHKHEVEHAYSLEITPPAIPQDDYEENDKLEDAYDLGILGSTTLDALTGLNQEYDYFKFTTAGTADETHFVEMSYTQAAHANLTLALLDAQGNVITNYAELATTKKIALKNANGGYLPAGDYYVRVYNADPDADAAIGYSLQIEAPQVAPVAPTNFKTNANESADDASLLVKNETTLVWDDVFGETGYELRYATDVAATDDEAVWSEIQTVDADVATFDTGALAYGTAYKFQIRAVNDFGASAWVDLEFSTVEAPKAPEELAASVLNPETLTVELSWKDLDNELGYVVELLDADGAVVAQSGLLEAGTTTWTTPELALGTTYQFQVTAKNNAGDATSEPFEFTTENVPTAPTKLEATVNASTAPTATLKWDAVESDAIAETVTGYEVTLYQIEAGGTVVAFAPQTVADATYTTETLELGGTYYFEVAAVNAYGKSAVATSETFTVGTVPATPTDLTATVDKTFKATLTWSDAATNEIGYRVEIQTQNADGEIDWTPVATLDAGATTWTSDALTSGETYRYRVVAFNDYGDGGAAETSTTLEAASTVVTSLADVVNPSDGWVSLREAIQYAEAGDVVTFDNRFKGGTISLHGTSLQIDKAITIDGTFGTGSPRITVDAYNQSGVFNVVAGTTDAPVAFVGLKITRGSANGGVVVANGSATFTNVEITGNKAFQGGGVHLVNSSATFTNVKIAGNEAERGGGVFAFQNSTATFTNVEIADNVATATGGGAFVYGSSSATFTNVAIVGNSATGAGGGVVLDGPSSATFTNATIAGNSAENGAAVLLNTPFFPNLYAATFYNSIVDGEIARGDSSPDARANAYNTLSTFTEWTNQATAETDGIYLLAEGDSLFAEGSYALAADSVALNKGDNAYVPETLTTDLAGNDRISGTNVDLGAYEYQGVAPTAPTGLTATVDASTAPTATLKWDAAETVAGYEVTLYQIEADGTVVAFAPQTVAEATWITPTLDFGGTYYFEVVAKNAYGDSEVAKSDNFTVGTVPTAALDVAVTLNESTTPTATLTWVDAADNETKYLVEEYVDGEWTLVANLAANATDWTSGTLELGATYRYRVVAVNDYGRAESEAVEFTVGNVPAKPTDLTMTNYDVAKKTATLTWVDVATNETKYLVQSSTNGGKSWNNLPNLSADATSRKCSSLTPGATFIYRVAAANDYGQSDWVEIVFVAPTVPTAALDVAVTLNESTTPTATLTWVDAADNETKYLVEEYVDGEWTLVAERAANATDWTSGTLELGATYRYRVVAVNDYGRAESEAVEFTVGNVPAQPTDLTAVVNASTQPTATLSWNADENALDGYVVTLYQIVADADGETSVVAFAQSVADAAYTTETLDFGGTYYFEVVAKNAYGDSEVAKSETFTVGNVPAKPTDLTMTNYDVAKKTATLTWVDVATNETKYLVQSSTNGGKSWNNLPNLSADATSRKCSSLTPGATFIYRVAAANDYGQSDWVEIVFNAPNVPNAPNNLAISNYDSQKMTATLSWSDVEGETKYVVQSSTNGGKNWNNLPELNADVTERHCTLLTPGKAFIYRVAAVNQYGQSEWVEVSVAPLKFESVIDATSLEGVLTWSDPLGDADGYEIETLVDGAWTNLATVEGDARSFDIGTLIAETQYAYRARAVYADSEPGVWTTLEFNVDTPPVPPTAPVDLTMSNYDPQKMTATLSWSDVEGETKYVVQSSTNGGKSWNNLPELNADTTTRRCTLLTPGQTFIYRVAAVNEYGQSEWTEIVFTAPETVSSALLTSAAFAESLDEFDFFVDEDDLDALAKRLV